MWTLRPRCSHLRVVQWKNARFWTWMPGVRILPLKLEHEERSLASLGFPRLTCSSNRLRLVAKDIRFSTWKQGFNSPRRYHRNQG